MTKEEFNKLDIHKKVDYINANIPRYGSASNVCKELEVSIETFRGSIKNLYTYVPYLQKYVSIKALQDGLNFAEDYNSPNGLIILDAPGQTKGSLASTGLNKIDNAQDKLINLLNNYDKIVNLIESAPEHPQSISNNSSNFMDLNMPNGNTLKKTTIRVNEEIWNDFRKCINDEFSHLEQYDLISVALRDFINKYSVLNK